jgi:hypothetical protein
MYAQVARVAGTLTAGMLALIGLAGSAQAGPAALSSGAVDSIVSVSCASAGNCAAGGQYRDSSKHFQAFVASEVNGTWRAAIEVPGTAALNGGGHAEVDSVSCGSAGNCSAGGSY